MPDILKEKETSRRWTLWSLGLILSVALAGLVTHVYLGSFSRFIADDYCSAAEANRLGIFRAAWYWYISWTGRYSANLSDGIFGALGPGFTPFVTALVIVTWLVSLASIFFLMLPKARQTERLIASAALAASILLLTLALTPNVRQSLYWSQGMRSVVPPLILGTCYVALFVWRQAQNKPTSVHWLVLSTIVSYGAGGFSETYVVFQLSAFVLAIGFFLVTRRNRTDKNSFLLLLAGSVGAILSLLTILVAPGNPFRQAFYPAPPAPLALATISIRSFGIFAAGLFGSIEKTLSLAAAIVIGISAGALFETKPLRAWSPWLILLLGIGLVFTCFPPSAYGLSDAPPDRTLVIPVYGLVITLVAFGILLGEYLSQRLQIRPAAAILSVLFVLVIGIYSIRQMISSRQTFMNYAAAWGEFHTQMLDYKKAGVKNVEISIQEMNDNNWSGLNVLGDNPKFWVNQCVSEYYGVNVLTNTPAP